MGMDVYGKNGGYFRRNVWGWRPLADLIVHLAPMEARGCKHWHSNDGDGLSKAKSIALAARLQGLIDDGTVAKYCVDRDQLIQSLEREPCPHCQGTGSRVIDPYPKSWPKVCSATYCDRGETKPHPRAGLPGWCNGCDGTGTQEPWPSHYCLAENDVREFVDFLRSCGGFKIC